MLGFRELRIWGLGFSVRALAFGLRAPAWVFKGSARVWTVGFGVLRFGGLRVWELKIWGLA